MNVGFKGMTLSQELLEESCHKLSAEAWEEVFG